MDLGYCHFNFFKYVTSSYIVYDYTTSRHTDL
jgi:hypothetical protein